MSHAHFGLVVQLVRISACHAEGRGFESRPDRFINQVSWLEEFFFVLTLLKSYFVCLA